ncbi:MAG: hypothetical protein CM15mP74_33240 [Halieaceae bacterium]|nr:MAG: hypothetical protein CM15mP74_33240 [Halieaceae bacterium]
MTSIIFQHEGTIDEFWGTPFWRCSAHPNVKMTTPSGLCEARWPCETLLLQSI